MGDDLKTLLEFQRLDALVMEQLHASPMVSDIYGHCALGILAEYCPMRGQIWREMRVPVACGRLHSQP